MHHAMASRSMKSRAKTDVLRDPRRGAQFGQGAERAPKSIRPPAAAGKPSARKSVAPPAARKSVAPPAARKSVAPPAARKSVAPPAARKSVAPQARKAKKAEVAEDGGKRKMGMRGAAPWAARHAAKHAEEAAARNLSAPKPGSARG